jgi:acyl carrier protein phosphodiesterase
MNHLAHLFLADPTPESRAGNFGADFFKGAVGKHDRRIRSSIRLHRAVDAFTDAHPAVHRSKARVRHAAGNASGVVVDLAYDHFLATAWKEYSPQPLEEFARGVYVDLLEAQALLPVSLRQALPRMVKDDWLLRYRTLEGVRRALWFLSRRLRRPPDLDAVIAAIAEEQDLLAADFHEFFPQLIRHAEAVKAPPRQP